jgi:hypothetical protein
VVAVSCYYIISSFTNERLSVVVSELASEHDGSGFESNLVPLLTILISY